MRKQTVFFILSCLLVSSFTTQISGGNQYNGGYAKTTYRTSSYQTGGSGVQLYSNSQNSKLIGNNVLTGSLKNYREQIVSDNSNNYPSKGDTGYNKTSKKIYDINLDQNQQNNLVNKISYNEVVLNKPYSQSPQSSQFSQSYQPLEPSNVITTQSQSLIVGGFSTIDASPGTDAFQAASYARKVLPLLSKATLIKASSQVVSGINYQFIFKFQYLPNIFLQYLVQVYKSLDSNYRVTRSQYYNIYVPKAEDYISGSQNRYLNIINDQVAFQLKDKIVGCSFNDIVGFDYYAPYYVINYRIDDSSNVFVGLIFDAVTNSVTILSTSKTSSRSKSDSSIIPENTQVVSSDYQLEKKATKKVTKTIKTTKTTTKLQRFSIPITFSSTLLKKYNLSGSQISYSNIIPYTQQKFATYLRIQQAPSDIKQLGQSIIEAVRIQIKQFDSQSSLNQLKYKFDQGKLNFGIISVIRGQKSMQDFIIILPSNFGVKKTAQVQRVGRIQEPSNNRLSSQYVVRSISAPQQIKSSTLTGQDVIQAVLQSQPQRRPIRVDIGSDELNVVKKSQQIISQPINNGRQAIQVVKQNRPQNIQAIRIQSPDVARQAPVVIKGSQIASGQKVIQIIKQSRPQNQINNINVNRNQDNTRAVISQVSQQYKSQPQKQSLPGPQVMNVIKQIRSTPNFSSSQKQVKIQSPVSVDSLISTTTPIKTQTLTTKIIQTPTQTQKLIIHQPQKTTQTPSFTISTLANNLLSSVSGISDPALIPFLTSSYTQTDSKQIQNIANFIINKVKITGDFTIVLVNQIKYGIRLVIQMKNDHKLFQAVVTSDNKTPQLLLWHRISKISDVNPDCFNQYHRINPDQDLKSLIIQVFSSTQALRKLKQIIQAQKKITFDGVYYRFTVQSISGNKYLIVFYYIPERNYHEIVRYQLINSDFDDKKQVKFDSIPTGNKQFDLSRKYLFDNYPGVLKDTKLSYLSSCDGKTGRYYRMVHEGLKGKYEAILHNNLQDQSVSIARWEKLEDGYIPVQIDRLRNNDQFKSIRNSVREYIQNKFSIQADPSYLSIKSIPASSSFYKFLFPKPFPFVLSVQQRTTDHNLFIRGLQRIQIAPTNQYYNDRMFAGYSVISIDQLQYDDVYQQFVNVFQKQAKLKDGDYQVKSAFRMKTPSGLFYKVIYLVGEKLYLASYGYDFVERIYKLLEFKLYTSQVEQGDYRWRCLSINSQAKICQACDQTTVLTSGRCYKKQPACLLQIAANCYTCQPGFIRASHTCHSSPSQTQPKLVAVQACDQTVVTATGSTTITYVNGNDQNCLQFQDTICIKCSYRYFVNNGICKKIQDQCDIYNNQGQCYKCYSGYYLSRGICIKLEPTCAQANQNGQCTKCYKNYVNIQGKCYIKSNIALTSQSAPPTDQLCIKWSGNKCVQCEFGCFWSNKLNKCGIKDPFCQDWSNQAEQCQICQRGYIKQGDKCIRND